MQCDSSHITYLNTLKGWTVDSTEWIISREFAKKDVQDAKADKLAKWKADKVRCWHVSCLQDVKITSKVTRYQGDKLVLHNFLFPDFFEPKLTPTWASSKLCEFIEIFLLNLGRTIPVLIVLFLNGQPDHHKAGFRHYIYFQEPELFPGSPRFESRLSTSSLLSRDLRKIVPLSIWRWIQWSNQLYVAAVAKATVARRRMRSCILVWNNSVSGTGGFLLKRPLLYPTSSDIQVWSAPPSYTASHLIWNTSFTFHPRIDYIQLVQFFTSLHVNIQ